MKASGAPAAGNPLQPALQQLASDSTGLNTSTSNSESEHTIVEVPSQQQPSPAPLNPFDMLAGDLSVSSNTSRNQAAAVSLPDSPLRKIPVFISSSPATSQAMETRHSPATLTTPAKQDRPGQKQQISGAPPPALVQPRVLPFDLPSQPIYNSVAEPSRIPMTNNNSTELQLQANNNLPVDDDDGNTEPSSQPSSHEQSISNKTTFARLLQSKRRKQDQDDDDEEAMNNGALIYGYLQKLGRNGKWQSRWFESDGECLSYYKSSKRTKLLATLDLEKVGTIEVNIDDTRGCCFRIEVLGRDYHLRAESRASCRDWVITLNRVKEARLQQGNVKLVTPSPSPLDLLDPHANRDMTPRVVVVSNRERTRAVDEDDQWDEMMNLNGGEPATVGNLDPSKRRSALQTAVLARWSKRNSSISRLAAKLARWARSLQKYSCQGNAADDVQLDRHVHPPGHDDEMRSRKLSKDDLNIFARENQQSFNSSMPRGGIDKANRNVRAFSLTSEDESRMLA
ncbi:hypothetical protein MPSEU_000205300 [Mayamaea pseudoterrestris]|nr:hypothetical protein MPSEU_000205300 [Mayamaea pseudoterrestris]